MTTPEEREKLNQLCKQIQSETDPAKLTALLQELDELLEKREPFQGRSAQRSVALILRCQPSSGCRWDVVNSLLKGAPEVLPLAISAPATCLAEWMIRVNREVFGIPE
jgi:hypothetical protein